MKFRRSTAFLLSLALITSNPLVNISSFSIPSFANRETSASGNDFIYELISNDEYRLVGYKGSDKNVVLDSKKNITEISKNAFQNSEIESITLTDSVKSIKENAFFSCTNLSSIKNAKNVTYIGYQAFSNCTSLTDAEFSKVEEIDSYAFAGCLSLTQIDFGTSLKSVGSYAFLDCTYLEEFTIQPDTVLGFHAFLNTPCNIIGLDSIKKTLSFRNEANICNGETSPLQNTTKSYINRKSDGTFEIIQVNDNKLIFVSDMNQKGELSNTKKIQFDGELFGSFFSGKKYNYILFGDFVRYSQKDTEAFILVRYSKDWKEKSVFRLPNQFDSEAESDNDSFIYPFIYGSASMDEDESSENLYISTCYLRFNEWYDNTQSQIQFTFNQNSKNSSEAFTVSDNKLPFSFYQNIRRDSTDTYLLDIDARYNKKLILRKNNAESIYIISSISEAETENTETDVASDTGIAIDGFELSNDECLILGSFTEDNYFRKNRDLCLWVADKKNPSIVSTNVVEDYSNKRGYYAVASKIVKLDNDNIYIMWEEENFTNTAEKSRKIKYYKYDKNNPVSKDIKEIDVTGNITLSDCQPIISDDRIISWFFVTNDGSNPETASFDEASAKIVSQKVPTTTPPPITTSNPETTQQTTQSYVKGDTNSDNKVDISDAVRILQFLANSAKYSLSEQEKECADVDGVKGITGRDALVIQQFDAKVITTL